MNPAEPSQIICEYEEADAQTVDEHIKCMLNAQKSWAAMPFADRASIFLKTADLLAGKYRYEIIAATMLGQGKTVWQAEIDAAAELVDFLRFNVKFAAELYAQQPTENSPGVWNRLEYRPLEGFVYAVSPFNFTAIGGNLACAPALMGNVVLWKPSPYAILSNHLIHSILLEAGLPEFVISWLPGDAEVVTKVALSHHDFAALHFTGSTAVFRSLCAKIGGGVGKGIYKSYPRVVGETGGKNFHLVAHDADVRNAVVNTVRGAFEYQGQKCSATSRLYLPKELWEASFRDMLLEEVEKLKMGSPMDFSNFIGPVIHLGSYKRLKQAIKSHNSKDGDAGAKVLCGGKFGSPEGYFIQPTVIQVEDLEHRLLKDELFGPVLTVFAYEAAVKPISKNDHLRNICTKIAATSEYALTGSIFAQDRETIRVAEDALRNAAGNFYINCKSTGAVVGQQPFGGGRASGTNDKAGSMNLLTRFVSMRSIKEEYVGSHEVLYPSNK